MHPYLECAPNCKTRPQLKKIAITNNWHSTPILTFNALFKWHEQDIEIWILRKNKQEIIMEQCIFYGKKKIAFWFVNISKERYRVIWKQKWNLEGLHETHHYTLAYNYQGTTFFLPWFLKNDLIDYAYSFMSCLMNNHFNQ